MTHDIEFGSVCSGIEAASVALHQIGWRAAWLAEIEPFPCAVLKHHYPDVPNLGDMTKIARAVLAGDVRAPDVLIGGTPCQAFSVAGLREGLADERGQLTLAYVRLFDAIDYIRQRAGKKPAICWWENVPGVLSSKDNAFGCFLAGLAGEDRELQPPGGKWPNAGVVVGPARTVAWRILDAQYFGVAQRRRRVFVIASARKNFDPVNILFEFDGVRRDSAPRREAGQDTAGTLASRTGAGGFPGTDEACSGYVQPVAQTLLAKSNCSHAADIETYVTQPFASTGEVSHCLNAGGMGRQDFETETLIAQSIGFNARQDPDSWNERAGPLDTDGGSQAIAYAIQAGALRTNPNSGPDGVGVQEGVAYTMEAVCVTGEVTHTLKAEGFDASEDGTGRGQPIVAAFDMQQITSPHNRASVVSDAPAPTMAKVSRMHAVTSMAVRRLTPRECERLQGFPDDYTLVPVKVKRDAPAGSGPCAKQVVTATVVSKKGVHYVGTNHCMKPQTSCPRAGMPTGVGYELCKSVCEQSAHAEVNALRLAKKHAKGATLYLEGHTYACEPCKSAAQAAGIAEIVLGKPPGNAADGPRYKSLGNSMAVPVMHWIGKRINVYIRKA